VPACALALAASVGTAAKVMLAPHPTRQQIRDALGLDPSLIAKLYESSSSTLTKTLNRLNPQMRAFFIAAGLSAKTATSLTQ